MIEQRRRRASRPVARPGEPNVLSNAATPNTLSTMGGGPRNAGGGSRDTGGNRAARDPRIDTEPTPRQRSASLSLGTLLVLLFIAITLFRIISELLR
jgi:hypothetical protein